MRDSTATADREGSVSNAARVVSFAGTSATRARPAAAQDVRRSQMSPWGVLAIILSIPATATGFWWLGTRYLGSSLSLLEFLEFSAVLAALVTGAYQLYFWVQRNNYHFPTRCFEIRLDDRIPFWPRWVWIYNLLYYLMLGLTTISIQSIAAGVHLAFGGLVLLLIGATLFYFFPTNVPAKFRNFEVTSLSRRYLKFVQSMDNDRNACPSMHCAVATYVGLAIVHAPVLGPGIGYGFIAALTVSCVVVKQHVIVDTIAGIVLGWAVFAGNAWLGQNLLN